MVFKDIFCCGVICGFIVVCVCFEGVMVKCWFWGWNLFLENINVLVVFGGLWFLVWLCELVVINGYVVNVCEVFVVNFVGDGIKLFLLIGDVDLCDWV